MKITSILFWGGMVTTIMLFALFLGLICQDIIYERVHNGVKYFFIIPIGILCVMFFLLSTLVAGTDIFKLFLSDEYLLWLKIRYFISGFCDLVIMGGNTLLWLYFISRIF